MAFLPVYDHDIFISFSPVDNSPVSGQDGGWAEQFYKNLDVLLSRRAGHIGTVDVHFTIRKAGDQDNTQKDTLRAIQRSAILIILDSDNYATNEECKKELDTFSRKEGPGLPHLQDGVQTRIIHILLHKLAPEKWPPALNGSRVFPFYHPDGGPMEIATEEFKKAMYKLVDYLWSLLNGILQEEKGKISRPELLPGENGKMLTIFLGEVAEPLRVTRNRIMAELTSKGCKVVSGNLDLPDPKGMEHSIRETLKKSDFAVHLLDENPGNEIKDHPGQWKIRKQTEWALESGKPQMIWVPAETSLDNIKENEYKLFLQSIEKGSAPGGEYEYVRGNKSTLTHDILAFASQATIGEKQQKDSKGKVSVMLDTHFCDQYYAIDLARTLLENNIQPYINPQEDDPGKNIQVMGQRLSQVNKLIFLYGKVSKEWLRERMNAALELIITNHYPIREFFVYMAPPVKETNNLFIHQQFLKVHVVNNSKHAMMNKNELQDFLKALNTPQE